MLRSPELLHAAPVRSGVAAELAVYDEGGHGFGLGREGLDCAAWPARCELWLLER